ncbi:hypothetical protein KKJ25_02875 [Xenorhabdus bovienii]|uniref:hypothetical protein n=2 Tax=Xenorhabdus bovienii TaxID=40576 RepID=UPI00237C6574|nr:hypothetical protein [Xenorhabdus bovienii]MDE1493934.1 hypothetical protein [Xenorhabdus bovienii]
MCMGCYSGIQRLIVYAFCFSFLFIGWPKPVTANPALVAGLLVRVIAQATAKRAATQVVARQAVTKYPLTEAAIQATIRKEAAATVAGMSRVAAMRAATVPVNSSLRKAGQVTWAGLGVASGVMTASELVDTFLSDNFQVAVEGVALGNGKYEVSVGGRTRIVDFRPSPNSPVILYGNDAKTPESDWGFVPSGGSLVNDLALNGVESYPVPAGVVQSNFLNNKRAAYSSDIPSSSDDYFYIEDDKLSSLKALFLISAVKQFERDSWKKPVINTVNGDNESFDYVISSNYLEVLDFAPTVSDSKWDDDHKFLPNAITSFSAYVPVVIHRKEIKNNYKSCEYPRIVNQDGSMEVKTVCTPPKESDYSFRSEKSSVYVSSSLNYNYDGNYFNEKNNSSSIKIVSASELTHLLKDQPIDNSIVANLINNLLHESAAQKDYEGITVSDGDYITESEVSEELKTVGGRLTTADLFSPIQDIELPSISTGTGIGTGSGTKIDSDIEIKVDFGSDPNVKLPDLGEPPSGKEIIQPIRDSMPFLSDFKIGGRDAACPVADISFSLAGFNFEQIIDSHCDVIEKNRKFIELIASLIWAFAALRMILSA